jgi:hypothetical protein
MAKRDQEELRALQRQIHERQLPDYDEDRDLTPSEVKHVVPLLERALEDRSLAVRLLRTFEVTVDKVPARDRASVLKWVIVALLFVIASFAWLKATGKW